MAAKFSLEGTIWISPGVSSLRLRELQVRCRSKSVSPQISANGVECFVDLGVQFLAAEVPSEKCMCIRTPRPTLVEDMKDDIPLDLRKAGDCVRKDVRPVEYHDRIYENSIWQGGEVEAVSRQESAVCVAAVSSPIRPRRTL